MPKIIRDPIHGDIFLEDHEIRVVDTPEFQRLRRIKQLGLTYLVYPSANHTRFEHSLGVMHLAGRLATRLKLDAEEITLVRMAALLHDVGHGPLSHTSEEILARYFRISHEKLSTEVIRNSSIAEALEESGISPEDVEQVISGKKGYLSKIISSEVDTDRMDYLVRDAHHTGVGYGIIDLPRLINTARINQNMLVFSHRGLRAVEGLLVARFLMIPTVYLHHTSRIADAMFLRATEYALEQRELSFEELARMDDHQILEHFSNLGGYPAEIAERITNRRLFKIALQKGYHDINPMFREKLLSLQNDMDRIRKIEAEIAEEVGLEEGYVILDIPPEPKYREMDAIIEKDGRIMRLEEASPLVSVLRVAQKSYWRFGIYVPEEYKQRVSEVAGDIESFVD